MVRQREPADEILEEVRSRQAALVIMRTHGRSGLGRAVLGSVAERIVKDSPAPVVLLRPDSRRVSQIRTLLVPVDGSPGGAIALGTALSLAKATGAVLKLLEVVVPIPSYLFNTFAPNGPLYVDPAWDEETESAAQTYVASMTRRLGPSGVSVTGKVVVASSVPDTIVKTANEQSADLIVMSSQALTGAARAFLGSVTDAVVRNAHYPILVIHRPPAAEQQLRDASQLMSGTGN